jgi:hypothetical protein
MVNLFNKELGINQPILKLKLFCKLCLAPCYFRGEDQFSLERPSIDAEHVVALLPFCYPEILSVEPIAPGPAEEEEDEPKYTVH